MNRLKGGEKKGERRFDRREGLKRLLTTILSAIPEAGVVGEWRGDGVALQQWFVAVSCRFATCMAISAPCPSIPSSHLVLAPRLLDNELSNYRHAFSNSFFPFLSLSLSSPFSSNTSFSQTSKLRKESNFFLLFFFSTGWKILYRFAEWSFHGRMGVRRITIRRTPRSRRTIIRRPWSRTKVADCRPTIRGNVPRSKSRRRRTSRVSGYRGWIPRGRWKRSGASSATSSR